MTFGDELEKDLSPWEKSYVWLNTRNSHTVFRKEKRITFNIGYYIQVEVHGNFTELYRR